MAFNSYNTGFSTSNNLTVNNFNFQPQGFGGANRLQAAYQAGAQDMQAMYQQQQQGAEMHQLEEQNEKLQQQVQQLTAAMQQHQGGKGGRSTIQNVLDPAGLLAGS